MLNGCIQVYTIDGCRIIHIDYWQIRSKPTTWYIEFMLSDGTQRIYSFDSKYAYRTHESS